MIKPFRVEVPQAQLDDLAARLAVTRLPDELPGVGWDLGIPLSRVAELVEHWRDRYDWRTHEAALNRLPQFTTEIDGQTIHFIHIRAEHPEALPLILTHGWPGSFVEFLDVVSSLSQRFHLVIPSIPGFGFSGPTGESGWGVARTARAWRELMHRLGYRRYGAQGGDWGAGISLELGALAPDEVVGVHVNYLPMAEPAGWRGELSDSDQARLDRVNQLLAQRPAYQLLHATRPQTLAYALTDSPVGQLAWIAEKFTEWVDPRSQIHIDRILTNVMIYWLTATAGSSARLAHETARGTTRCPVPLGVAVHAHDITRSIKPFAQIRYDVRHWSEFDRGGHFAAMEVPELFSTDVTRFFDGLR